MRERFRIWYTTDVRWGEMDSFGHLNNTRYLAFCESARIRYFDEAGFFDYYETEQEAPALVTTTCNFRVQVRYPEVLEVGTRIVKVGRSSFTHEYGIFRRGEDVLVADATSVCAWIDYGTETSVPLPEALRARIREIDPDVP